MRAAAILGWGCSAKHLRPFQTDKSIDWLVGMPSAADGAEVVVLFGGDGTIHRQLGELVKLGVPVLIVPSGSGNDFARALGLGGVGDSVVAWRAFCAGKENIRTIDLGVISRRVANVGEEFHGAAGAGRYFCSVAGVGLDAEVTRRANRLPRWLRGHGGYALTAVPTIFRYAAQPMKISVAEEAGDWRVSSERPTILAALANSPIYGGGMRIAPQASLEDGLLDVCVIRGMNAFRLASLFPSVYFGKHLGVREVDYFRAAKVLVETERPCDLYADGEYVCSTPAYVGVQRAAMRVVARA
jgi:diacylglycerol kinase family enzyme